MDSQTQGLSMTAWNRKEVSWAKSLGMCLVKLMPIKQYNGKYLKGGKIL